MNKHKVVTLIGAGFSGLTLAYYLVKKGFHVKIYEKSNRVGGLIQTIAHPLGLIETAANGMIASESLFALAEDLGVELIKPKNESRKRFIYRGRARQWPLSIFENTVLLFKFALNYVCGTLKPKPELSIYEWGKSRLGKGATEYLLSPGLSGIYAGDAKKLSSFLILNRFFNKTKAKPLKYRGTTAPKSGMEELLQSLKNYLVNNKVEIILDKEITSLPESELVVLCCGPQASSQILSAQAADLSAKLKEIELLPLVSVTQFYKKESSDLKGFGILFPSAESFNSLGVLFNADIFEGRSQLRSETWILGGALSKNIIDKSDDEILSLISADRKKLAKAATAEFSRIQRWPKALPHYTLELEKILIEIQNLLPKNIYLHGNYLGRLGLSQILESSKSMSVDLQRELEA